jgi:hypothetical protein
MDRWQYAWLRFGGNGPTAVFFSHPQNPQLIAELAPVLGPSLIVPQSSEWTLTFNGATVNLPYVCGLLGDRGWELVNADTLIAPVMGSLQSLNPQTTLYFKHATTAT